MTARDNYKKIVVELRKVYGTEDTTDKQLNDLSVKLFGMKVEAIPWDYYFKKRVGAYCVINTDNSKKGGEHWVSVYKRGKTLYIYDSFGRQSGNLLKGFVKELQKNGFNYKDSAHSVEQSGPQGDCGLRALAWLFIAKHMGIKQAMTI